MNKNYYLTTTLPYVNSDPHIGFALEIIQADALCRYHRMKGETVIFNTGTDEHGLKIYQKALEGGLEPKEYCDVYAAKFDGLRQALNLTYTNFIRTTDEHHLAAAQEFWKRCDANGDIYKKTYKVKYCVGCELEKTDSELVDGRCPIHPNRDVDFIDEENYFFRFSKYQEPLLQLYEERPDFVVPSSRLEEIRQFVKGGLEDFSISRLKSKMPWGVPVPGDDEQVMYVWFDALVNYISTLGWPQDNVVFEQNWPGVQVAGKDNLRQQSAMWQAMLMSAQLEPSKQIFIHGFITSEGQKMSKSLGNVVDPYELVGKYGTDPVRFYLLGALPSYDDGDFSMSRFDEYYGAHLANGIGNLNARILTMVEKYCDGKVPERTQNVFNTEQYWDRFDQALTEYKFDEAIKVINELVSAVDGYISVEKPWEKAKQGTLDVSLFYTLLESLRHIGLLLLPVMPNTGANILSQFGIDPTTIALELDQQWGRLETGSMTKKADNLFPRIEQT